MGSLVARWKAYDGSVDEAAPPTKPGAWTVRHTKRTLLALLYGFLGLVGLYAVLLAATPSPIPPSRFWAIDDPATWPLVLATEPDFAAVLGDHNALQLDTAAWAAAKRDFATYGHVHSLPQDRRSLGPGAVILAMPNRQRTAFEDAGWLLRFMPRNRWVYIASGNSTDSGWWEFERE